uniref:Uncharacterized protein n=1 Tax=Anguilla anguilla TaxID=7936 RepID=A0A0E9XWL3_ANGAN
MVLGSQPQGETCDKGRALF